MTHPQLPDLPGQPKEIEPVERALLAMCYGVHVIGSRAADGSLNLMLADWVMQTSFEPRMVLVSIENNARTLRFIRETGVFSVNLLHEKDGDRIARKVVMPSDKSKISGRQDNQGIIDKLKGLEYGMTELEVPVLYEALAWYDCEVEQEVTTGDHTVVIGRVRDGDLVRSGEILTEKELGWEYAG
jgi:flavin reductase (DIM6/NTAB) family NADH-FMN oxidoreductase RutF